jgi:hypothetical protein
VASVSGPAGARSRGRPRLPKAATRRPMPCTPGTPRAPSRHACTLRTGGPSTVVLARAFPRCPPSVRRSIGGPHVAYLAATAPGRDAHQPSPPHRAVLRRPWASRGELQFPADHEPKLTFLHPPSLFGSCSSRPLPRPGRAHAGAGSPAAGADRHRRGRSPEQPCPLPTSVPERG